VPMEEKNGQGKKKDDGLECGRHSKKPYGHLVFQEKYREGASRGKKGKDHEAVKKRGNHLKSIGVRSPELCNVYLW